MRIGLATRVVPAGEALTAAQALAYELAAFPQQCMRADRQSALTQWDLPLEEALVQEGAGGYPVVQKEAIAGAEKFARGAGRHGAFEK